MRLTQFLVATAVAFPLAAIAQQPPMPGAEAPAVVVPTEVVTEPAPFVMRATQGNTFEIEASRVIVGRTGNPDIRAFAEQLIADHTDAAGRLATAAQAAGVEVPQPSMSEDQQVMLRDIQVDTQNYDHNFARYQVTAHANAIALFEGYAENAEAGPLKDFAAGALDTLRQHHERAVELADATAGR